MKKKNLKTGKRATELKRGKSVRVERLVRQIADRLFTVSFGTKFAEKGTRLAVMKGNTPHETHLGGWCRSAAESEIEAILSNVKPSHSRE